MDQNIKQKLREIVNDFSFIYVLYIKFDKILKEIIPEDEANNYREYGWTLFIILKQHINQEDNDIVKNMVLLVVVHLMLYNIHNQKQVIFEDKQIQLDDNAVSQLCQLIKLNNKNLFLEVYKKATSTIQSFQPTITFDKQFQIEKLNQIFKAKKYFDERIFLKINDRQKPHSPIRKNSQSKDSIYNIKAEYLEKKNNRSSGQQGVIMHTNRKLFENIDNISLKKNYQEMQLKNLMKTPEQSYYKVVSQTPLTNAMENYNWLHNFLLNFKFQVQQQGVQYSLLHSNSNLDKYFNNNSNETQVIITRAINLIDNVIIKTSITDKDQKKELILKFFFKVLHDLLVQEEKKSNFQSACEILKMEIFHKSLIGCCIEVMLFIFQNSDLSFLNLLNRCEITSFDFWKILQSFMNFDYSMPFKIKEHLQIIDTEIINHLIWRSESMIDQIEKNFKEEILQSNIEKVFYDEQQFNKIILKHIAYNIFQLSQQMNITGLLCDKIWHLMNVIIKQHTRLFKNRHLGQFIICSTYAVFKTQGISVSFNNIIQSYQKFQHCKNNFQNLILQAIDYENKPCDIITFYNIFFIKEFKQIVTSVNNTEQIQKIPQFRQDKSPFKAQTCQQLQSKQDEFSYFDHKLIQTNQLNGHNITQNDQLQNVMSPIRQNNSIMMTPNTKTLYAFGESLVQSPSEKYDDFKSNLYSQKRHLNFNSLEFTPIKKKLKLDFDQINLDNQFSQQPIFKLSNQSNQKSKKQTSPFFKQIDE